MGEIEPTVVALLVGCSSQNIYATLLSTCTKRRNWLIPSLF
ncbi:hypothetical protein [Oscillatoria acuminata]|nr:hypothetical protein [Oscillatoria acuminata]